MNWKIPEDGRPWVSGADEVRALFEERMAEGEIPEGVWEDLNAWANAEAKLEKPGEESSRSGPITIFTTFLALPFPHRYEFLGDYIEN